VSRQTQAIEQALLPTIDTIPVAKKADLAILLSRLHPDVKLMKDKIATEHGPRFTLSQLTDAWTCAVPQVCGFEIKAANGDAEEASLQLAVFLAAGITKNRRLADIRRAMHPESQTPFKPRPMVGWTVVRHGWHFHMAWEGVDGTIVSA
jgi:hypothetical protein